MSLSRKTRQSVRLRANFACEFCSVSELDTGGELTIDHFQPTKKGGSDSLENLIYCCPRCNQYKQDYFPQSREAISLWNPRREPFSIHFFDDNDGKFQPFTDIGKFTLAHLRLNRPQLVEFRLRKKQAEAESNLLRQIQEHSELLEKLKEVLTRRLDEQTELLKEQRELLKIFIELFGG